MPHADPIKRRESGRKAEARYYANHADEINRRVTQRRQDSRQDDGRESIAFAKVLTAVRRRAQKKLDRSRRLARMRALAPETYRARERRRAATPRRKIASLLRNRLRAVLSGRVRGGSAVGLLGCTPAQLVAHIERQFGRGMTWDNHGKVWELDHIRPLAGFDLSDAAQLAQACHFTNLQPLPSAVNRAKGAELAYLL